MTANKGFKKLARSLAAREGLSYAAARRRLMEQPAPDVRPAEENVAFPGDGGPWVSVWDGNPSHDVNAACGHHLRRLCGGCGVCTVCDGCYCREAAEEAAIDAQVLRDEREHADHAEHHADCALCEYDEQATRGYTRCPKCGLSYPDGYGDHQQHNPPYCLPLPRYRLGVDWGYLRGQHVTLVGPDYSVHGLVLADQDAPDPHDYRPHLRLRRTDPGYEDGPGESSPVNPREWREVHPAPPSAG